MTSVWISHNPFSEETEIIIDGYPIADTSRLYKYIKTPMQNWVGIFLPMLVEHCNDDELSIVFEGLQYHYEDLDAELKEFLKKNSDYEIKLQYQQSPGVKERLAKRSAIIADMEKQDAVPSELVNSLSKSCGSVLQVLISGGAKNRRKELEAHLAVAYKKFPMMKIQRITDLEAVKQAVDSEDKPVIICLVDEHSAEKEPSKIINLLSDAYKVRGRTNKWRFLFVSDSPLSAKRILSSDFAIKNAEVYALDELALILQRIDEYRDEVWQIRQMAVSSADLCHRLSILKQRFSIQAEQEKMTTEIDKLEKSAIRFVDSCKLKYEVDRSLFLKNINQHFKEIRENFLSSCLYRASGRTTTDKHAKNSIDIFIGSLPMLIRKHLHSQAQQFRYTTFVETPECDYTERGLDILEQFRGGTIQEFIQTHSQSDSPSFALTRYPNAEVYISSTEKEPIVITPKDIPQTRNGSFSDTIAYSLRISFHNMCLLNTPINHDYYTTQEAKYELYKGIKVLFRLILSATGNQLTKPQASICEDTFNRNIKRFEAVFLAHLDACIEQGESEFQGLSADFESMKDKTKAHIKEKVAEMRRKAQISAVEKQRLEQIQQLLERAEALTKL